MKNDNNIENINWSVGRIAEICIGHNLRVISIELMDSIKISSYVIEDFPFFSLIIIEFEVLRIWGGGVCEKE